jgi:hypothetical protein
MLKNIEDAFASWRIADNRIINYNTNLNVRSRLRAAFLLARIN